MPYADWAGVSHALSSALGQLPDGECVILGEPPCVPAPRRGLFARAPKVAPARYVQALRLEEVVSGECVGATSFGGTWEMSDATIAQLRGLGWLTPAESHHAYGHGTPNFGLYVDPSDAPGLADLMTASLEILGAHPATLVLQRSAPSRLPLVEE
ncbi:MAG: hypothetical protein JWP24_902 [Marmoricola sp.]|jgi:hypothetical protein|nr:hypothetical protein [Marmoricola sp.]